MKTPQQIKNEVEKEYKSLMLFCRNNIEAKDRLNRIKELLIEYDKSIKEMIEDEFSEGWYQYFYTIYAGENEQVNENMIEDINKKMKQILSKIGDGSNKGVQNAKED